jgi:TetR/AcrR family transcriptional regulator, ethionamide resistance regulator
VTQATENRRTRRKAPNASDRRTRREGPDASGDPTRDEAARAPNSRTRRETVRADLCRALLGLLEETSFKEISVDDIAVAAGIKRSAFYFYFQGKQDLLVAAASDTAEALYAEADRWWHGRGRPERRLEEALRGMAALYERHAALLRVATEVSTYDDEVRVFWRELIERFIDATASHLEGEQRAGRVPTALEPRATAESLVWMAERCCYIYLARGERTAAELVESLSATWTAALYPRAATRPT